MFRIVAPWADGFQHLRVAENLFEDFVDGPFPISYAGAMVALYLLRVGLGNRLLHAAAFALVSRGLEASGSFA